MGTFAELSAIFARIIQFLDEIMLYYYIVNRLLANDA